mmetsp:Transcript_69467/g.192246  ORF Transcript_69467/g.192246 Transcript_69467/m.192246 type:complete len:515 (-) Transcript_69467:99-1643(-)|eukprot:CAMPEP_0179137270 /NCGR_PEP_ID=MMETSP0796-20121207/65475_1 /TAXON_ID=73915 /ORGANISM="Pyrodinium bahamense, Strain pbaha01" /LENGTH=514 /DNA_ID=CAMNT_0020836439 /DNA_START=63 /DNA_END=1607 /DNA_ORIENTATION=-
MAAGVIAHVPNEEPKFVPIAAGILSCGIAQVAARVRQVLNVALFGAEDEGTEEADDFRLLFRERDLEDERCAASFLKAMDAGHPCVVRVIFHLLGGKGGFGSLLRGQKGRGKKTTNMDAMRDLSGRRLRHSKAVERIKEWMEKQKREDDLVNALKGEGPELPKPVPQAESLNPDYVRRLKRAAAERPALVSQGMRNLLSETAGEVDGEVAEAPKRGRQGGLCPNSCGSGEPSATADWFDALGTLAGLSSPEEENEPEAAPLQGVDDLKLGSILWVLRDPAEVVAAGSEAGLAAEVWQEAWEASVGKVARVVQIDSENSQVKCRVPGVRDVWFAAAALALVEDGREAAWADDGAQDAAGSSAPAGPGGKDQSSASSGPSGSCTASSGAAAAGLPPAESAAPAEVCSCSPVACAGTEAAPHPSGAAVASSPLPSEGSRSAGAVAGGKPLQPEDVKGYVSAEDLAAKVHADVLKLSLQQFGMKCGGKPEERAARLFLLKDKSLGELPKSVFAAAHPK